MVQEQLSSLTIKESWMRASRDGVQRIRFEVVDGASPCLPWFARVPSISNCADYPSRGLWSKLRSVVGEFVLDEAECCVSHLHLPTLTENAA